jgi:hypothetical protein
VIYSDRSLFTGLPILQALRRHEIVGMQIEPWGPKPGSHEVVFCGRPTRVQLGPFAIARVARAPVVAVFALRTGIRRYELPCTGRFDPTTRAESVAALEATATAYGRLIREYPGAVAHVRGGVAGGDRRAGRDDGPPAPARRPPLTAQPGSQTPVGPQVAAGTTSPPCAP